MSDLRTAMAHSAGCLVRSVILLELENKVDVGEENCTYRLHNLIFKGE